MIILLSGCVTTAVKPVGDYVVRHEKINLRPKDFSNINEMRANSDYKITWNKFLVYTYVNENEYDDAVKQLYE